MNKTVPIHLDERATVALLIRLAALLRNTDALRVYGVHEREVADLADTLRSQPPGRCYRIPDNLIDVVLGELKQSRESTLRHMKRALQGNGHPLQHDEAMLATYSSLCEALRNAADARTKTCPPCTQDCDQGRRCDAKTPLKVYLDRVMPRTAALLFCAALACSLLLSVVL